MRAFLVSVALILTESAWDGNTPVFGLYCPSTEAANRVARIGVSYAFASSVERSGCQYMEVRGSVVGESYPFNIGAEVFTFQTIDTPSGTVYYLKPLGPGFIT